MPNQPEQKDRHTRETVSVRLSKETLTGVEELQKKAGLDRQSTLTSLIEQGLRQGIQNTEFQLQWCQFRSLCLSDSEHHCKCRKYGYWRTIETKECIGCSSLKTMRIFEGVEQAVQDLGNKKRTLTAEVQELEPNTRAGLLDKIEWLEKRLKIMGKLLREKDAKITELNDGMIAVQNDGLKSSIEPYDKIHSEQNTNIAERITEKKKITEKFREPQQTQQPKTQPSQLVLCPETTEYVSFEDVCKKTCQTFMECPNYKQTVMLNKALGKR